MGQQRTKTVKNGSESGDKYYHDQDKVNHVIEWIAKFCSHPTGDLQGQPMIMPEWFVKDVITPAFGTKKVHNGKRRYQEVYMEVASGNAKSTLGICVALYCLCADGQNSPRVYCVAGSKEQARIIFNGAKMMVQNNPDLAAAIEIFRDSLVFKHPDNGLGTMTVISADGDLQQGLNPTAIFFDEVHVQPNSYLYDSLKKNFPKRKEPWIWELTTAGVNFTFAAELHDKAVGVKAGTIKADGLLPILYAADLEADDFDEEQWKLANPGWDYLNIELLRQEAEDAKKSATGLAAFRRYHLNKWAGATVTFISDTTWMLGTAVNGSDEADMRAFRKEFLSIEALKGRKCYVGLDFSTNRDTTAAVFGFPPIDEGERMKIFRRVYIPRESLDERIRSETAAYLDWFEHNEIVVTEGSRQDQEAIFADLEFLFKQFKILCVAYDRYNADMIISRFEAQGIETKPYKQDYIDMNTPMKKLDTMAVNGMLEHGGDPVLRWQCGNLEAKTRTIGGSEYIMPTKANDKARIDGMVALIIMIGIWIWKEREAEEIEKSLIKKNGVFKIKMNR